MSLLQEALPERKRTYRVALTPLADAMFQLLIFFMLSTSLTPFSLITLRSAPDGVAASQPAQGSAPAAEGESAPPAAPQGPDANATIWNVGDGTVTTRGQVYDRSQLKDLANALGGENLARDVLVFITQDARMQDVAAVMEALRNADIDSVQIATLGEGF